MVCFFEVVKWMDIDKRLGEKNTSISDLMHTGGGTPHLTDLSGPVAHSCHFKQ